MRPGAPRLARALMIGQIMRRDQLRVYAFILSTSDIGLGADGAAAVGSGADVGWYTDPSEMTPDVFEWTYGVTYRHTTLSALVT